MATVTGMSAPRMLEIEANSVVSGNIDFAGNLILTTHGGEEIDAGNIRLPPALEIDDTSTLDLTLTGLGVPGDPWIIKGDLENLPASIIDSGVFDLDRIPNLTVDGILEASYRTGGPAKVKIAGVLSTSEYEWASTYIPNGSRAVKLMRTGSTWIILGQREVSYPITLDNTQVRTYAEGAVGSVFANTPKAFRLPSGIVVLSGLLYGPAAIANGAKIATIPAEVRPDKDVYHSIEAGDLAKSIVIQSNGEIRLYGTFASANYISLDGVAYPGPGVATWIEIGSPGSGSAIAANFQSTPSLEATYGKPAYWKDPYGFVWYRGLVEVKTALSVNNTAMIDMPAGYRSDKSQHTRGVGNQVFAGVYHNPGTGLGWMTGGPTTVGSYIALTGLLTTTPDAIANNPWAPYVFMGNSWANYNIATYPGARYCRREDGLVVLGGLLGSGSLATSAFNTATKEFWPRNGRLILGTICNNQVRARLDLGSEREAYGSTITPGSVNPTNSSNVWYSLDGCRFVP